MSDFSKAIPAHSVPDEYEHVCRTLCSCGGSFCVKMQTLVFDDNQRPFDVISTVCEACGAERDFLFDISSFFGDPCKSFGSPGDEEIH